MDAIRGKFKAALSRLGLADAYTLPPGLPGAAAPPGGVQF